MSDMSENGSWNSSRIFTLSAHMIWNILQVGFCWVEIPHRFDWLVKPLERIWNGLKHMTRLRVSTVRIQFYWSFFVFFHDSIKKLTNSWNTQHDFDKISIFTWIKSVFRLKKTAIVQSDDFYSKHPNVRHIEKWKKTFAFTALVRSYGAILWAYNSLLWRSAQSLPANWKFDWTTFYD